MITDEQYAEIRKGGIEWWRSDAAIDHRGRKYLEAMLLRMPENRRQDFGLTPEPDWPAVAVFDCATEKLLWVECKVITQLRDYMRTCLPPDVNAAACRLAKEEPPKGVS